MKLYLDGEHIADITETEIPSYQEVEMTSHEKISNEVDEWAAETLADLTEEELAALLRHFPAGVEGGLNKRLALTAAENLSREEGQAWYHFIVLMTRLM